MELWKYGTKNHTELWNCHATWTLTFKDRSKISQSSGNNSMPRQLVRSFIHGYIGKQWDILRVALGYTSDILGDYRNNWTLSGDTEPEHRPVSTYWFFPMRKTSEFAISC